MSFDVKFIDKIEAKKIGEFYKIELEILNNKNNLEFVKETNCKFGGDISI